RRSGRRARDDRRRAGLRSVRPCAESRRIPDACRLPHRRRAGARAPNRTSLLRASGTGARLGSSPITRGDARMRLSLPLIVALIIAALLTAGSMAVRSVSRIWLRHWAERQLRGAAAAATYLERPHALLTAANAGVALALLVAGMMLGSVTGGAALVWASLILAGIVVLGGQLLPRAIARRWPVEVAPFTLPVLRLADVVTRPILAAGRAAAGGV